ncbi:MAG: TlpA family protein disulfide reductase [Candidatus Marinimicrobia bacterium]|nr:TlpA family protein disulfide reductase [Candidatus Neomarinimicrobiota bacterium]
MKLSKYLLYLILGITILGSSLFSEETAELKAGDVAPTFFLRTLENEKFFLSKELQEGNPIVLAFYATWCVPCRQEIPALEKMMKDPGVKKTRLYYVNVGGLMAADEGGEVVKQREEDEKVKRHRDAFKMTHPILLDRYALTAQKYGAQSLPTLVVIGGDGKLKYHHKGFKPGDELKLLNLLKTL